MAPLKSKIKLKGRLKRYMQTSLYLGFLLAAVNLAVYLLSVPAGVIVSCFALLYFTVVILLQINNRPVIMNELVSFATQYGQVQKVLLRELEIPYAVLDDEGRIIWTNQAFEKVVHKEKGYRKSITSLFPSITKEKLPDEVEFVEMDVDFEDRNYVAKMRKIAMREMIDSSVIMEADNYDGFLIAFYLFDET
ncbi:MAG: DHH family phosphoesterase, partial [Lachnospiraceae bacterium]|nr:DHH family phosphoesterase [Lachnospiraceae bacterium]